jgi:hypothetical protein
MKILILFLGILIGFPAISQTDSLFLYSLNGQTLVFANKLEERGVSVFKILPISLRKATKQDLSMGMDALYYPESDVQGGNARGSKATVIMYQSPVSVQVTQEQLDKITAYIKNLLEPLTVPDVVTIIDDAVGPANQYMLPPLTAGGAPRVSTHPNNTGSYTDWNHWNNQPWNVNHQNNSISFCYLKDAYLEIRWTGYKIEWYTEKRNNHGIAGVSIDGGPETNVDLYKNTTVNSSELVYTWTGTTNAPHTLRIRVTDTKNDAATEKNIIHDYVKVYSKGSN